MVTVPVDNEEVNIGGVDIVVMVEVVVAVEIVAQFELNDKRELLRWAERAVLGATVVLVTPLDGIVSFKLDTPLALTNLCKGDCLFDTFLLLVL